MFWFMQDLVCVCILWFTAHRYLIDHHVNFKVSHDTVRFCTVNHTRSDYASITLITSVPTCTVEQDL